MTRGASTMIKTTILLLVLMNVVLAAYIPSVETPTKGLSKIRRSLPKLCSKRLSNALATVCHNVGYNEPFSHGNQQRYSQSGPGLVDECCYHSCTIQQLQQYCKATPSENKSDIIVTPNHPHQLEDQSHSYSTLTTDRQSSPRPETVSGDSADVGVKCKNMRKERHGETRIRNNVCKGKNDGKKHHHRGRHCRCRRRCLECRQAGKINES